MYIGVLVIEIMIYSSSSLKEKRFILKSIKDRVGKKFNVSISELAFQDKWQRARLGIATISNQYSHAEKSLHKIFQYLDEADLYEITSYEYSYY